MRDRSRPHQFPQSAIEADVDLVAWKCEACGKWVNEYRYDERGECAVDWRNKGRLSHDRKQALLGLVICAIFVVCFIAGRAA